MINRTTMRGRSGFWAGLAAITLLLAMLPAAGVSSAGAAEEANGSHSSQLLSASGATSGWFVDAGFRHWVSADCRGQIEGSGDMFTSASWDEIAATPRAVVNISCDEIQQILGAQSGVSFVTNSANNDAGWVLVDGAKQWVNATCRAELTAAGATFAVVPFAQIANLAQLSPAQTCASLVSSISPTVISGDAFPSTCNNGEGVAAIELTGDIQGCLIFFVETGVCTELNGFAFYQETGNERFIGSWQGESGEFTTTYTLEGTYAQGACTDFDAEDFGAFFGKQLTGGCDHFVTGSSGVFAGVEGLITFHDVIPNPGVSGASNFFYEGYLM